MLATFYATVSAGFTVEQEGLPILSSAAASGDSLEEWNSDSPHRRLEELRTDTHRNMSSDYLRSAIQDLNTVSYNTRVLENTPRINYCGPWNLARLAAKSFLFALPVIALPLDLLFELRDFLFPILHIE